MSRNKQDSSDSDSEEERTKQDIQERNDFAKRLKAKDEEKVSFIYLVFLYLWLILRETPIKLASKIKSFRFDGILSQIRYYQFFLKNWLLSARFCTFSTLDFTIIRIY